ncbi:MAG: hypothetical protein S4CHLAM102_05440 [Chlamydiia bacterium]|nr:hypothetical protein [Chlamydiia bacterium]
METNLKKLLSTFAVVCACMTTVGAASHDCDDNQKMEDYCMKEGNCCAAPRVNGGADVFISADFILWIANQSGLGMQTTGVPTTRAAATLNKGKVFYPTSKVKPGFKVDLGVVLDHDCWDIFAEYTWFNSTYSKRSTTNSDAVALINPEPQTSWMTFVDSTSGKWNLRFNNIDLTMGRNYWNSEYLSMRPHIGLKGSWQRQNFDIDYTQTANAVEDKVRMKQNYWGVGLRSGLQSAFYFNKEFSLFGDFAMSALWSQFKNRNKIQTRALNSNDSYTWNAYNSGSYHIVTPVLEMALGLRWDTWISNEEFHFMLQAGWELQEWWSQNNFNNVYADGVRGDMTLQGLTIKARFDF